MAQYNWIPSSSSSGCGCAPLNSMDCNWPYVGATGPQGATGVIPPSNAGNVWTFTGDGTTTTWTLTGNISGSLVSANYLVSADGVLQAPANYTINNVSPRTLTISTVPSGSILVVVSLSTA